jgi:hypothetical protein
MKIGQSKLPEREPQRSGLLLRKNQGINSSTVTFLKKPFE